MKKLISVLAALGLTMVNVTALAQDVTVLHNGTPLEFDVAPFIEEDRTMVPMRAIFEAVGASVTWDGDTRTVVSAYKVGEEQNFVILQIGNSTAFVGSESVELDAPARIVDDRTFVPLRFVMESLGHEVTWDAQTYTVNIVSK